MQKRISREPLCTLISGYISTDGNTKYIAPEGEILIKSRFAEGTPTTMYTNDVHGTRVDVADHVHTMIVILKEELESKNMQLAEKDKQIGELTAALQNTTASLHAAQALHAGTMQKKITSLEPSLEETGKKPRFFSRWFGNR